MDTSSTVSLMQQCLLHPISTTLPVQSALAKLKIPETDNIAKIGENPSHVQIYDLLQAFKENTKMCEVIMADLETFGGNWK